MSNFKWDGQDVQFNYGSCIVYEDRENPFTWWNYECGIADKVGCAKIPAILIETENGRKCIANHFGIGEYKISQNGDRKLPHLSLPAKSFEVDVYNSQLIDMEGFRDYEINRERWFNKIAHAKWMEELPELTRVRPYIVVDAVGGLEHRILGRYPPMQLHGLNDPHIHALCALTEQGLINVNGVIYRPRPRKPIPEMNFLNPFLRHLLRTHAPNPIQGAGIKELVEEFGKVEQKKSTLSRSMRDQVIHSFNRYYERADKPRET